MFQSVSSSPNFPQLEEEILEFWSQRRIYESSLRQRQSAPRFVFYEGPPTANGMPHPGHCLTRAIKDLFPRYRTMRGYLCERKAGWDTHGLPVEVEVCKELGIHAKEEIEAYGIEPFIHKCQQSVWRYMKEWERLTQRIGFWIHLDEAYVTYHQSYVESVWWSLKNLFERGLLYQGNKIVWWWAQGGTALSSGEVGQGYREVADPSVYVRFPLVSDPQVSLLVWTTTPWTLPSNQFAAVHPDLTYVTVRDPERDEQLILAEPLLETITSKVKRDLEVVKTQRGAELVGLRYLPPFSNYYQSLGEEVGTLRDGGKQHRAWRVVEADFVTTDSGTGVVHQAPAFGEVDYDVLLREQQRFVEGEGPELICAVGPDGKFTQQFPEYQGRWVKEADRDIARQLKQQGTLYHQEQYLHEYPFCWRADEDPLIQYPRKSWFVRTTRFKDEMLANNSQIQWLPEHIRDGRFGNFLETNVDWALSRERYWGTPLPIWVCGETGRMEAVASYAELLEKPGLEGTEVWEAARQKFPDLPEDLKIHKPYIDALTYDSPFAPGARMTRVPEVIDCWYDSGAMPFAQWGYPHQGQAEFARQFPADFISEAIDQTRGWFYSQLAISTLLFGRDVATDDDRVQPVSGPISGPGSSESEKFAYPHPYRNCVVLGLMLGEDGTKMSKQKRNYREPQEIFDRYGADALRWYFFANQAPWTSIRYKEQAIKESIPEFLLRLWNVYSFFVIYARMDDFDPTAELKDDVGQLTRDVLSRGATYRPLEERGELDRWLMSELQRTVAEVVERMDGYDNFPACRAIHEFVDALSNWYVRRSRARFWSEQKRDPDKLDAYWTLYECLLTLCKLIAPFTPFLAETIWRNLAGSFGDRAATSVHLCDYPTGFSEDVDQLLSERMKLLRILASLGRNARMDAKLKVRQPLALVEVVLADTTHQSWLEAHDALLREELNVKEICYTTDAHYIAYQVQPNFKRLGPRIGKNMPAVKKQLGQADGADLLHQLKSNGHVRLEVAGESLLLDEQDLQVTVRAKEGWAAADDAAMGCVVVLNTQLSPELLREGYARDLVRLVNERRKELGCDYNDRIQVGLVTPSSELATAMEENEAFIRSETLAVTLTRTPLENVTPVSLSVAEQAAELYVAVVKP